MCQQRIAQLKHFGSLLSLKTEQISILQSPAIQGCFSLSQDEVSKNSPLPKAFSQGSTSSLSLLKAQSNTNSLRPDT